MGVVGDEPPPPPQARSATASQVPMVHRLRPESIPGNRSIATKSGGAAPHPLNPRRSAGVNPASLAARCINLCSGGRPARPRGRPSRRPGSRALRPAPGRAAAASGAPRGRRACRPRAARPSVAIQRERRVEVTAVSASSSDKPIPKHPSAIANGSDGESPPPGFTSVASATGAPASISARAGAKRPSRR